MGTCNFYTINAQSYHTINDTYIDYDENGNEVERQRDTWDYDDYIDCIRYNGEESGLFPYPSNGEYNNRMKAMDICSNGGELHTFGNGNAWTTETYIESTICLRSGYYSGAIFDYDIRVQTYEGVDLYLSDYDNEDDLVDDYLDILYDLIEWQGHNHKWNVGTFKMHKENIRKWLTKLITAEIEKCEKFCKDNAEDELAVYARFSNGETWYTKVG